MAFLGRGLGSPQFFSYRLPQAGSPIFTELVKVSRYCTIQADQHVYVQSYHHVFDGIAEPVTDPDRVADFLEYRRKRHPLMLGLMMKFAHQLPMHPSRTQFLEVGKSIPLMILRPPAA